MSEDRVQVIVKARRKKIGMPANEGVAFIA
jgi:hypothetical protein